MEQDDGGTFYTIHKSDAVAELVERKSAFGKTAVRGLISGSVSLCLFASGQNSEFGNSIKSEVTPDLPIQKIFYKRLDPLLVSWIIPDSPF